MDGWRGLGTFKYSFFQKFQVHRIAVNDSPGRRPSTSVHPPLCHLFAGEACTCLKTGWLLLGGSDRFYSQVKGGDRSVFFLSSRQVNHTEPTALLCPRSGFSG